MEKQSKSFIRLKRIIMKNFRNIEYGKVDFPNSSFDEYENEEPSILGFYGQNGSGKTSCVMAIGLLRRALAGLSMDYRYNGCIRTGCDHAELEYEFTYLDEENRKLSISYSFHLTEKEKEKTDEDGNPVIDDVLYISNEILSYKGTDSDGAQIGKTLIADTTPDASKRGYAFGRDKNYKKLIKPSRETTNELREEKAVCYSDSRSFLFSEKLLDLIEKNENNKVTLLVLTFLQVFGQAYLHIIDNSNTGINNMNIVLPLLIWSIDDDMKLTNASALLKMGKHDQESLPENYYPSFCNGIDSFNEVLCQLIPGFSIEINDLGVSKTRRGTDVHNFTLYSNRKGIRIPLNYESDGIRRIVSIMTLLIGVFNQRSMTVVIDEIDSGIYEYLLGEILRIMSSGAKGQLVFTSHNLRALEVLPSKYVCFTSTNPKKRFVKLIRTGNSNLRDLYIRKIVLGSDDEQLYDPTDNYEIELAFYNAGRKQDKTL